MAEQRVSQTGVIVVYVVDPDTDEARITQSGALVAYVEEPPEPSNVFVVWID